MTADVNPSGMCCGGLTEVKEADEAVQNICEMVHVGGDEHIHLRVYESWHQGEELALHGVLESMTHDSPIDYFE
ncbi:hypothetical protein NHX12_006656 [Muraenolepis orangiensis]|uniref:Uncharacterized protein n=1 Tax=Muraenolepis orangiensis TaxID=630683 RepID=A0A9Q0IB77_9TELE|nr:hypothetical protein NHX12_006656 [Muraenolepis orangiensis]